MGAVAHRHVQVGTLGAVPSVAVPLGAGEEVEEYAGGRGNAPRLAARLRRPLVSGRQRRRRFEVAGEALFIGWGQVVRGREQQAFDVFNESVAYWNKLKEDGTIDDFEVVLLAPHGGDLGGFALVKGDPEKLAALRYDEEFERQNTRADFIIEGLGIVDAYTGEALGRAMGLFQQQIGELT
jgi:hypothetical protein